MFEEDHFLFAEEAPFAAVEVLFGEAGVHHPIQLFHFVFEVLEDTADNAVLAAVDLDADLRPVFGVYPCKAIYRSQAVFQLQATEDALEVGFGKGLVQFYVVDFFTLCLGWASFCASSPSLVSSNRPDVFRSRRPTG